MQKELKYCKQCLQPDSRPGIRFNDEGICPVCIYHDTLSTVDWSARSAQLNEIANAAKKSTSSGYDCIMGVSGGKDSTRQAHFVKDVLGMNPLLVCLSYPPQQVTERGVRNISNLISNGFDCITIHPAPETWRQLMRLSFLNFSNWGKSTELALYSSVPRLAIAYQIPLIWWGENTALQLGDLNVMGKDGSDGNNLRNMNTLGGGDFSWILREGYQKNEIIQYCYPSIKEMDDANLQIRFLGYFWKDWSKLDNGNFAVLRGLETRVSSPADIGDIFGVEALDEDWVGLNQMIKYYKFGFGKVTDIVNEEIRYGRMSRDQAISLVKKYDGTCSPKYIESFCRYIGISTDTFWEVVDKNVNHYLFKKIDKGVYKPLFNVGENHGAA